MARWPTQDAKWGDILQYPSLGLVVMFLQYCGVAGDKGWVGVVVKRGDSLHGLGHVSDDWVWESWERVDTK